MNDRWTPTRTGRMTHKARGALWGLLACATIGSPSAASAAGLAPTVSSDLARIVGDSTLLVQLVMIVLLGASITSWAILFVKLRDLATARRPLRRASDKIKVAITRHEISPVVRESLAVSCMLDAVEAEWSRSDALLRTGYLEGLKERAAAQLMQIEQDFGDRMGQGLQVLATVSSVAPFVGLFGTVFGIMHSFLGIAAAHSTSLAVVAPGIAEALLATGVGLAAAIPATLMYNALGRRILIYRAELSACATTLMCIVSRDLDSVGAGALCKPTAVTKTPLVGVLSVGG